MSQVSKKSKESKESKVNDKGDMAGVYITMSDIRRKVLTFRDLIDLPPCLSSASPIELLITTLDDLHKMYPDLVSVYPKPESKGKPAQKVLAEFYDAMRAIREIWIGKDELMDKPNCVTKDKMSDKDLKRHAMVMLEEMIRIARERSFDMMDEDESVKSYSSSDTNSEFTRALSQSSSYSETKSPLGSPATPTSVLPTNVIRYTSPLLLPLRVKAVGKLNPIDIRRLSFPMFASTPKDKEADVETIEHENKVEERVEDVESSEMEVDVPEVPKSVQSSTKGVLDVLSPPPKNVVRPIVVAPMPPPPPPMTKIVKAAPPRTPPPAPKIESSATSALTTPPQPPGNASNESMPLPPPPPQPPSNASNGSMPPPPPPPPGMASSGSVPLPPPPMPLGKGGAPPPPPPGLAGTRTLRPKKAATKLKRSSQMGNLYRLLKVKVEGSNLDGKSQGRKGKIGAPNGGQQSMADALAEMTKRSAYFQQIEEDVRNHAKTIAELQVSISAFQTADMTELIKFHKHVESHLEKLTDETQVLARFEDFPGKKLEALRMAAALYSKLDALAKTLQNWKIEAPLGQLLERTENYFNKIKVELETLERTKDEESKKFQSHKITFDFGILLKVKELMVDVSSSCMELALKEKGEAKAKETIQGESKPEGQNKGSAKLLWRAFQFAYKVYTFAGGHDDRADTLTRELAHEIECDPNH